MKGELWFHQNLIKAMECEKAEQQAKEEKKTAECIEMYRDMSYLYARLVLQLKQMK